MIPNYIAVKLVVIQNGMLFQPKMDRCYLDTLIKAILLCWKLDILVLMAIESFVSNGTQMIQIYSLAEVGINQCLCGMSAQKPQ